MQKGKNMDKLDNNKYDNTNITNTTNTYDHTNMTNTNTYNNINMSSQQNIQRVIQIEHKSKAYNKRKNKSCIAGNRK